LNRDTHQVTFQTWNKVAKLYQEKFMNLNEYEPGFDYFYDALVRPNADILDIGCGPGNISKYLLNKNPNLNITGIDYAPNMIKMAIQNNPNATYKIMDARDINKIDSSYDGIVCGFCLPYLSESETAKFISDSASLLNDNGILYISFVEGDPENSGYITGSTGDQTFFYYHQESTILRLTALKHLVKKKSFSINYKTSSNEVEIHKIIICQKSSR